jgi:hypothetical protein
MLIVEPWSFLGPLAAYWVGTVSNLNANAPASCGAIASWTTFLAVSIDLP